MNSPLPPPDDAWTQLVRRARADVAPTVDVAALLRAVRQTPPPEPVGWLTDFGTRFGSRLALRTCLLCAAASTVVASWEAWTTWQVLPWAQLLSANAGGVW